MTCFHSFNFTKYWVFSVTSGLVFNLLNLKAFPTKVYELKSMAGPGSSMLYSFLLFVTTLSLQEMYRGQLASSELYTILGGFSSSFIFLTLLTFIGNYQETNGIKCGWGAVVLAEAVALVAASTVHRVCITTCLLFSVGLLYEINKLSVMMASRGESKAKSMIFVSTRRIQPGDL